jgi:hypothetical protein
VWGVGVKFHAIISSALYGGEYSASRFDRFFCRKIFIRREDQSLKVSKKKVLMGKREKEISGRAEKTRERNSFIICQLTSKNCRCVLHSISDN